MHKFAFHRALLALALALPFGTAGTAAAATATGTLTLNGSVTYAPPPASCTVNSPNVDVTYEVPYQTTVYQISKTATVLINCTSGAAYSLKSAATSNLVSMGDTQLRAYVVSASKNIYTFPISGTGNGAQQSIPLTVNFQTLESTSFNSTTVGAVSGSIALTLTY